MNTLVSDISDTQIADNNKTGDTDAPWRLAPRSLPMDILLKKHPSSSGFLKLGELVEGRVLERRGSRLYVDLGARGIGVMYGRESAPGLETTKAVRPGDSIIAKVVELDNEEGYVELSVREAGEDRRWLELKKAKEEGTVLDLPVRDANRGGLILEVYGIQGFLPASQLAANHYPRVDGGDKERIQAELKKFVGTTLRVKVFDFDPREPKLIFTEKGIYADQMRSALTRYNIGETVDGTITGVVDFGAFVKFGDDDIEGLIHISEIDWTLVEDPRALLKPGDVVRAKIIGIQGGRVALSRKALQDDPWRLVGDKYRPGDMVEGRVVKLAAFGAFVELPGGLQGLSHVSSFGSSERMHAVVARGKTFTFPVLSMDADQHRILLGAPTDSGVTPEQLAPDASFAAISSAEPTTENVETVGITA
ncbi:MAG: S1 RNA-binding domain-containing protein [Patescibacteria group bacterium]